MSADRHPERESAHRARDWWSRYCEGERRDAASVARLRRCRSNVDALTIPAAVVLAVRLGMAQDSDSARLEQALGLARLLAHVKADAEERVMRAAGWKTFPGDRSEADAEPGIRPVLSELRFKRLLLTAPGEDLVVALSRLVRLLGHTASVADLSAGFLAWGHERTRKRWAFEYYAAGEAAPGSTTNSMESHA